MFLAKSVSDMFEMWQEIDKESMSHVHFFMAYELYKAYTVLMFLCWEVYLTVFLK